MANLSELIAKKEALEAQIAQIRQEERSSALQQIRTLIAEFEVQEHEVFSRRTDSSEPKVRGKREPVPAKYKDPETGKTWSGRGPTPSWLKDKNRDDFLI